MTGEDYEFILDSTFTLIILSLFLGVVLFFAITLP